MNKDFVEPASDYSMLLPFSHVSISIVIPLLNSYYITLYKKKSSILTVGLVLLKKTFDR